MNRNIAFLAKLFGICEEVPFSELIIKWVAVIIPVSASDDQPSINLRQVAALFFGQPSSSLE